MEYLFAICDVMANSFCQYFILCCTITAPRWFHPGDRQSKIVFDKISCSTNDWSAEFMNGSDFTYSLQSVTVLTLLAYKSTRGKLGHV